jgi:hypothetical protein
MNMLLTARQLERLRDQRLVVLLCCKEGTSCGRRIDPFARSNA